MMTRSELRWDRGATIIITSRAKALGKAHFVPEFDYPRVGIRDLYRLRVLGQWFDGIRFYAAASSPRRSRRTWAGLR